MQPGRKNGSIHSNTILVELFLSKSRYIIAGNKLGSSLMNLGKVSATSP